MVSDAELRNEIGMNQAEINKFRGAVNNNRTMDWNHVDDKKVDTRDDTRGALGVGVVVAVG